MDWQKMRKREIKYLKIENEMIFEGFKY